MFIYFWKRVLLLWSLSKEILWKAIVQTITPQANPTPDIKTQNPQLRLIPEKKKNTANDAPTWAEDAFVAGAGEVVAFAEAAVDFSKLRVVAETLVAAALPSPAADLFAFSFPTGAEVHAASLALLALAPSAQEAWLTATSPAVISTCKDKSYLFCWLFNKVCILLLYSKLHSQQSKSLGSFNQATNCKNYFNIYLLRRVEDEAPVELQMLLLGWAAWLQPQSHW